MHLFLTHDKACPTRNKLVLILLLTICLLWLLSPISVSAFVGLGDYISERMLGDGTNEFTYLGDGSSEMLVLGAGPTIFTLPATGVSMTGGGHAVLRGNLTNLNGAPRADTWFSWGYSPSSLPNTTPVSTVFTTGGQTSTLTGFNAKQEVYYRFNASTDGTSIGLIRSFIADKGFLLLEILLPVCIALAILVFMLLTTGNLVVAMVGSVIGLIAFYVIQALLQAIS